MTASEQMRSTWESGGTALGAWVSLRDPLIAETAASVGYDYVCLDMQHGMQDYRDIVAMLSAMARTPVTPIVRVPWNEPGIIGRVLDAGAYGVIIPMVNSAEQAMAAVASCRYAPVGSRSMGPAGVSARTGRERYFDTANEAVLCIPMIETREAVEHIDEILSVPGIDAVYIGPADLSITYGLYPKVDQDDADWNGALVAVRDACVRHDVIPGIHADSTLAAKRHEAGFRMITVGFDLSTVVTGYRTDLAKARAATS